MRHKLFKWFGHLAYVGYHHGVVPRISFFGAVTATDWLEFGYEKVLNVFKLSIGNSCRHTALFKGRNKPKTDKAPLALRFVHHMKGVSFVGTKPTTKLFGFAYIEELLGFARRFIQGINATFHSFWLAQGCFKRIELCPLYLEQLNSHLNESLSLPSLTVNHNLITK